jgi:hypothetical protein
LERCHGDDRSQVGQALIRARRLIRLNRRTVLMAAYVEPNWDRAALVDQLIHLFDGPQQRELKG